MNTKPRKIAIFVSYSGRGGVERVINLLCQGFLEQGVAVDLLVPRLRGEHGEAIPPGVTVVKLSTRHTFSSALPLAAYLKKEKPGALLAVKHRGIIAAVVARFLSGFEGRLVGNIHTNISVSLEQGGTLKRAVYRWGMRTFYARTDLVVGVSEGVARDIMDLTGLPAARVKAIHNPVVFPEMEELGRMPVEHPWFSDGGPPVILGIGRLTKQKDFATLVRAFAEVIKTHPSRLVVLGEGADLDSLRVLAGDLGIAEQVDFPGFQRNPYKYLSRARLFTLSSRWEGFGMVLVEAMALGTPVVSTDCPSGPREILKDGLYGPLVPPEEPTLLSQAMIRVLENPPDRETLRSASEDYTLSRISRTYLETLLG